MSEHAPAQEKDVANPDESVAADADEQEGKPLSRAVVIDRWTEIVSTILLAIVAVAAAWSGYQSTRWSGVQADNYVQGSGKRVEADRAATLGGQDKLYDLQMFNNWLNAYSTHETELANIYERRFRDEFRPFFKDWLATDPFSNPAAPAGPFLMTEYHTQLGDNAEELEQESTNFTDAARKANQVSDDYVFVTVFLAVALFFVAIGQRFDWALMKWVVLALAVVILIIALIRLAFLPVN